MDKAFGEGRPLAIKERGKEARQEALILKGHDTTGIKPMGSALRILLALMLISAVGLSACGRRGSLERPQSAYPQTDADPSAKMSRAPDRRLPILDALIE